MGLGPGDPADLTLKAERVLRGATRLFLRTSIHPTITVLGDWGLKFASFDELYREGATFEAVYQEI
ncbi:MAG: nucleotide pyrophosphohydrolase, partial [Candidatus Sericytochromatia bacterium]|nr:nucleotide pyrophosphohydrolase [Candidatus Tanganyikabacteria bacterium]